MELDDESSLLTPFETPHGRYRWFRLPLGLCVSSEIFQKHLNQELLGLPGVKCTADDVLICGRDDAYHNSCLEGFMKKCQQKGIKLNHAKLEYKCKGVPFHGHVLTSEGPEARSTESQGDYRNVATRKAGGCVAFEWYGKLPKPFPAKPG